MRVSICVPTALSLLASRAQRMAIIVKILQGVYQVHMIYVGQIMNVLTRQGCFLCMVVGEEGRLRLD